MVELSKRGETIIDSFDGREEFLKQKNKIIIAALAGRRIFPSPFPLLSLVIWPHFYILVRFVFFPQACHAGAHRVKMHSLIINAPRSFLVCRYARLSSFCQPW